MRGACLLLALAACGDNDPCAPTPPPLPAGELNDPYAMPLPEDCAAGGLAEVPGRWFVSDPYQRFSFWYPHFEGSCSTGFANTSANPDAFAWSDGTIYFLRADSSDTVVAEAYCVRNNSRMAVASAIKYAFYTIPIVENYSGQRFTRREPLARGLSLVGEANLDTTGTAMFALDLAIDGHYAYVVGQTGFDVFDVTSPSAPIAIAHYPGSYNDVAIVHGDGRTLAYLAPFNGQHTEIVEVTDPSSPSPAGEIVDYSHTLFVQGSQLYLATYTNDIPIFDISHPATPVRMATTRVPGPDAGVHDMFVDGNRIYANNTTAGLVAFDVSAGFDRPIELGHVPTSYSHTSLVGTVGGRPIVLHGDEGMTMTSDGAAFLRILDGDPASPTYLTELARYQSRPDVSIHNFQLVGDRLYIAYYEQGVRVLDLSDPTRPSEVAHFNTWDPVTAPGNAFEGALGIQVVGDLVYVADDLRGLVILRDPALTKP